MRPIKSRSHIRHGLWSGVCWVSSPSRDTPYLRAVLTSSSSNADWNFPSPTATPTNPSFGNPAFQTPKTSTFPSHFQDAFSTPQMPDYATPLQPQCASMIATQRPQSSSETLRSNFYANVQAGQPPIMQQPGRGYGLMAFSPVQDHGSAFSPVHGGMHPLDSVQMQTPPPTRGTSVKKSQQPQIAFGTPSTIASRRFMTPQQPAVNVAPAQHTPVQFPQLQFSPELYHFANPGPASAPIMPQTQLLWDNISTPAPFPQHMPLDDPFAPGTPVGPWPQHSPYVPAAQPGVFQTPAMPSFPTQAPQQRPASASAHPSHVPAQPMQPIPSTSLDPSLIYSSPIRPVVHSGSRQGKTRPGSVVPVTKRKDSAVPQPNLLPADGLHAFAGPGLLRSNTTGPSRPKSSNSSGSASDSLSRSSSTIQPSRTASPLKRAGRLPLGSISERKPRPRPSVILTVDENGNARTETRPVEHSPTKSIRERYPGLFDSDTSDDDSDTSEQPPSRDASFTFAKGEGRKIKAARLEPPVENLEGIDLPRSSSRASNKGVTPSRAAIAAAATLRRQGSLRRSSRTTPAKANPMTRSASSLLDTCPMSASAEQFQSVGGAESELAVDAHNRHRNTMFFDQQHQAPPPSQHRRPPPNTHRGQRRGPLIRCVCGVPHDRNQLMVQCCSCTQFLHMPCVGLDGSQVPAGFVCGICETPGRR